MIVKEFFRTYCFHDSLLESVSVDHISGNVTLEIDFCFWQQDGYDEASPETGIVYVNFYDVSTFIFEDYQINSDEIAECEILEDDTIIMTIFSDLTNSYHTIQISADKVEIEV